MLPKNISAMAIDVEIEHPQWNQYLADKYPQIKTWWHDWTDYKAMGIALIGIFDWVTDRYYLLEKGEFHLAQEMAEQRDFVFGFRSNDFDVPLLKAHGINMRTDYDLLEEIRLAVGLPRKWTQAEKGNGRSYTLETICEFNFNMVKAGDGEQFPIKWQRAKLENKPYFIGEGKRYLMGDLKMTKTTADHIGEQLIDPNTGAPFVLAPVIKGLPDDDF